MTTRFMGAGSAAAFRGMANASRISGDAIRAGGVAAASSNTVRGAIFNSMRGTASHLGTVTKGAYRHQINAAKNTFLNAVARETQLLLFPEDCPILTVISVHKVIAYE